MSLVKLYLRDDAKHLEKEHQRFVGLKLRAAIVLAASKKLSTHQRRIPVAVLSEFRERLLGKTADIEKAGDFGTLYEAVAAASVRGIGPLTIYDVARRLGASLGTLPTTVVYLHTGAKEGDSGLRRIFTEPRARKSVRLGANDDKEFSYNLACA